MKHTFPCGIVGESHSAAGDAFLAQMIRQPDLEDGPTEEEKLRSALRAAHRMIAAICIQHGGSIRVEDLSMAQVPPRFDTISYRDESRMATMIEIR